MRLDDITPNMETMSDEELRQLLTDVRRNRTVDRPAAKKRKSKAVKKAAKAKTTGLKKLLENMSDAEKAALIAKLEGGQ